MEITLLPLAVQFEVQVIQQSRSLDLPAQRPELRASNDLY
jgi:hypothetical protein